MIKTIIIYIRDKTYNDYIYYSDEIYYSIKQMVEASEILCPCCDSSVAIHGTYERRLIISEFERLKLCIIRVRCKNCECRKSHSILPEFLVPHKHYVRTIIENSDFFMSSCPADESTIRRWRSFSKSTNIQKNRLILHTKKETI